MTGLNVEGASGSPVDRLLSTRGADGDNNDREIDNSAIRGLPSDSRDSFDAPLRLDAPSNSLFILEADDDEDSDQDDGNEDNDNGLEYRVNDGLHNLAYYDVKDGEKYGVDDVQDVVDTADLDGDGVLTREELETYMDETSLSDIDPEEHAILQLLQDHFGKVEAWDGEAGITAQDIIDLAEVADDRLVGSPELLFGTDDIFTAVGSGRLRPNLPPIPDRPEPEESV